MPTEYKTIEWQNKTIVKHYRGQCR